MQKNKLELIFPLACLSLAAVAMFAFPNNQIALTGFLTAATTSYMGISAKEKNESSLSVISQQENEQVDPLPKKIGFIKDS